MFEFSYGELDLAHRYEETPETKPDFAKHYHDFYELLYFAAGECEFVMEDVHCRLTAGDVVFILPGEHHYLTYGAEKIPCESWSLKFGEKQMPAFLISRLSAKDKFYTVTDEMKRIFAEIDAVAEREDKDERGVLAGVKLVELLILLSRAECGSKPLKKNKTIARVVEYVDAHIREPLTLSRICSDLGFSSSYLSNKFSGYMKVSLIQYVRIKKIVAAHRCIVFGERPTRAAKEFGFADYSTFYRAYVRIIGRAPVQIAGDSGG